MTTQEQIDNIIRGLENLTPVTPVEELLTQARALRDELSLSKQAVGVPLAPVESVEPVESLVPGDPVKEEPVEPGV